MGRKNIRKEDLENEIYQLMKKNIEILIEEIEKVNRMIERGVFVEEINYPIVYIYNPYLDNNLSKEENKKLVSSVIEVDDRFIVVIEVNNKDYEVKIKNKKLIVITEEGESEVKLPDDVLLDKIKEEYNNGVLTISFEKKK